MNNYASPRLTYSSIKIPLGVVAKITVYKGYAGWNGHLHTTQGTYSIHFLLTRAFNGYFLSIYMLTVPYRPTTTKNYSYIHTIYGMPTVEDQPIYELKKAPAPKSSMTPHVM